MHPPTGNFLKAVLESSWQGSMVILLILLLRPLLGMRVPARWRYLLWTLVLLRLLVPAFILPPSPASLQNFAVVDRPFEQAKLALARAASRKPTAERWRSQGPDPAGTSTVGAVPPPAARPVRSWWQIAAMVWLAGVGLAVLWILAGTMLFHRRLRRDSVAVEENIQCIWQRCCAELALRRPPRLLATGCVESPALIGLLRPALLLPMTALRAFSSQDWQHVFLHELAHFRRRDHWMQALQLVALCAHWFNPLVWLGFRYLRADRELAADEWALRHLDAGRPVAYGDTLLKVLSTQSRRIFPPCLVGIMEDGAQMKQRLRHIVGYRPHGLAGSIAGAGVALALAAIVLTAAKAEVGPLAGWSVVGLSIPKDGEIKDAYVELKSPTGRAVTLTEGFATRERVALVKVGWSGSHLRATVMLRKGSEHVDLSADAALISKRNDLSKNLTQVEIASKFFEVPDAVADNIKAPGGKPDMGKFPGKPPLPSDSRALTVRAVLNDQEAVQLLETLEVVSKNGNRVTAPGVDHLSAPRVIVPSQRKAVIEIIREFRYPSEWNPPDQTYTYWTPKAFETRDVGITLEVEPTVIEGNLIDLKATPQVVEFLGCVDFETKKPLYAAKTGADHPDSIRDLWPKGRWRPVFSTRKSTTDVSIESGQTFVLVGRGEIEDTKPFESPLAGRQLVVLVRASAVSPDH